MPRLNRYLQKTGEEMLGWRSINQVWQAEFDASPLALTSVVDDAATTFLRFKRLSSKYFFASEWTSYYRVSNILLQRKYPNIRTLVVLYHCWHLRVTDCSSSLHAGDFLRMLRRGLVDAGLTFAPMGDSWPGSWKLTIVRDASVA